MRDNMPDTHIVLDTEARIEQYGGWFEHHYATGALAVVGSHGENQWSWADPRTFDTTDTLWGAILTVAERSKRSVMWAHNLAYDLRVSNGLRHLLDDGWTCKTISLARVASWGEWTRDEHTLIVCDSFSWFHSSLDRLAAEMGSPRPAFNYEGAQLGHLQNRCRRDCALLAVAVTQLLDWLTREYLGPFRPTGSGQSHSALRRRFLAPKQILIHCDGQALAAERLAMHTGRTEAWRWGKIREPLYEFDMNLAYCRIAATHAVPGKLLGELNASHAAFVGHTHDGSRALAEAEITTAIPLVPLQREGRVLWPTGKFTTTLWDPEIQLLLDHDADVNIKRLWGYSATDALKPMSEWIIDQLNTLRTPQNAAYLRVIKHWARALVGRMALRYSQWEYYGDSPFDSLELATEMPYGNEATIERLQLGHTAFIRGAEGEANSSCPQIPGWVQSHCRRLLWRIVDHAGPENVYYMDTDGLLVNKDGAEMLRELKDIKGGYVLLEKAVHRNLTIHGPRQVEFADHRKISGLPSGAIRTSEITWSGETWEGLEPAMRAQHTDHVAVTPNTWTVTPTDNRRKHLPDGLTRPHKIGDTHHGY